MRNRHILGILIVVVLAGGVFAVVKLSGKAPVVEDATVDFAAIQSEIDAGDFESARTKLEAIVAADETNAEAHFSLGLTLFNLGDYTAAGEHFTRSLQLDPERAAAVHHNLACWPTNPVEWRRLSPSSVWRWMPIHPMLIPTTSWAPPILYRRIRWAQ